MKMNWRSFDSKAIRNQRGDFLIEAVVAVLVSSIIGTALIQMYTQVKRVGNMASSELLATAVGSGIVDHLRGLPYNFVAANLGDHFPAITGTPSNDPLFPYPLLHEAGANYDYTAGGDASVTPGANTSLVTCDPVSGATTNTVRVNLAPVNGMTGVQVTVTMSYLDTSGKHKTYSLSSVLTPNGLNG
ncbi:MAG: hypothetical protein K2X77_22805 [Candidatus Obscuribacterales bacterium]|jgi:hypothetical protein|nr:hypothetical protein [Candidatus Obscuribacterales bacterium]